MKTSISILAAVAGTAFALPQASPPDNTVVKQSPKFKLRAINIGKDQSVFDNDSYAGFFHVSAGTGGNLVALTDRDSSPDWYLSGTELYLQSGGATLQFDGTASQGFPFVVAVDATSGGIVPYTIEPGQGSPSFGNFTQDGELYVSHMQTAQNGPTFGCKGDIPQTKDAVVLKYAARGTEAPEGCSQLALKVELI